MCSLFIILHSLFWSSRSHDLALIGCPAVVCDMTFSVKNFMKVGSAKKLQSPLLIVDLSVSGKLSTITRESTIAKEIHAKIDILSA